jgi:ectonucleotide pyrophosphatase/phosphodiesterase family member 4
VKRLSTLLLIITYLTGGAQSYEEVQARQVIDTSRRNSEWAMQQPYLVLVSIDGFRYDYAEKFGAKNLLDLKQTGSYASAMIPSFPSKTFPNHYTLVTGLVPSRHGIVGNEFYSKSKKEVYDKLPNQVRDGSWYRGVPIWSLAESQGMLSASFFWIGSEAEIAGYRPTYFYPYKHSTPDEYRSKQVLDWLALPEEKRPHLILMYLAMVDDTGHRFGPDSPETKAAALRADELIGHLRDELKKTGLPIYLMVTSDHGMIEVNRGVSLEDVDFKDAVVVESSTMFMVYHDNATTLGKIRKQLEKKKYIQVMDRKEIKAYSGFEDIDRVGDLNILVKPPAILLAKPTIVSGGTHGYCPVDYPEMNAIFMVEGPDIKKGFQVSKFENIHVYPFAAQLLNLKLPDNLDGKVKILAPVRQ